MIYREQTFKEESFEESDVLKECTLIDCELNGALLVDCKVIESEEVIEEPECIDCMEDDDE